MFKKLAIAALALGLSSGLASTAQAKPKYELRRVSGPRNDIFVLARVDRPRAARPPHAVTASGDRAPKRKLVQRWAGPHYIGPVYEFER